MRKHLSKGYSRGVYRVYIIILYIHHKSTVEEGSFYFLFDMYNVMFYKRHKPSY